MIAKVLVEISNRNVDKTFDYQVPSSLTSLIAVGKRVLVPFSHQTLEGFVLALSDCSDQDSLKDIINVVDDEVILNDELLKLGKYVAKKTLSTLISAYQTMLPKALKAQSKTIINKRMVKYIELNKNFDLTGLKLNATQQKIISHVCTQKIVKKEEVSKISVSSLKTLLDKKILLQTEQEEYRLTSTEEKIEKVALTSDQQRVVDQVLLSPRPNTFLLNGVTGSGKTEVYMEIIDSFLQEGKQSIVLVPEISLTPQTVSRFRKRFGNRIAVLHSRLSEGEKYDEYRKIARDEVDIVIGARSAVFAPLKRLGAIIIDEEHSTSYKQENNPKYNTIDIAIERGKYHSGIVVLGSATPSLESYSRAVKGVYKLLELKNRVNNKKLPLVEIIDLNKEKTNGYFSNRLINAIEECLHKKEQIILLLNRRGYSSFVTCSNCGYVEKCPNCDITLTYYKSSNNLRCHYCGYEKKMFYTCPSCREDGIKNFGVGTEKIEEKLKEMFSCRVVRMDFDTTSRKGAHEKIIKAFHNHDYDILLGTQMIAKGLDFPNVTLVGVINSDTSLMIPNFRSSEYTFQLLSQVAGRSGRGDKEGKVIIQTHNPNHYAIALATKHDYQSFFKEEMQIRKQLSYSPYFYMVSVKIISKDYDKARDESNRIGKYLRQNLLNSIILGPTVCSVFKVNNLYRFSIIIKYKKEEQLSYYLLKLLNYYKNINNVNIDIDFDPINI